MSTARQPEILAPAGGVEALRAAIAAKADAVYLGLGELDARRGADGYDPRQLPALIAEAHAGGTRVHLTLNIQVSARELGRAARTLAWAEQSGIDAVLIADPALLPLMPAFPKLQVHWSTQAGISSSAGVRAAGLLGVHRVVLAREMSLEEIAPCCAAGPEVEVFAQGALCFSVSGRCSMTSWVGGRSGNRGTCTSICRVNWSCNGADHARPLDMKDNSAVRVLPRLVEMGVHSLKIEGRLKTAEWVTRAVGLYRRGVAGTAEPAELWREAEELGAYSGRDMTDAYYAGTRTGLVHPDEGRRASEEPRQDDQDPPRELRVACHPDGTRLRWDLAIGARRESFHIARTPAHPGRDVHWAGLRVRLDEVLPKDVALVACDDHCGDLRLPRRVANDVAARIALWVKPADTGIDRLKIAIPDAVRDILAPRPPHPGNRLGLRDRPDRARIDLGHAAAFAARVPAVAVAVEVRTPADYRSARAALGARLIAALPPVVYEAMIPDLAALCALARADGCPVECNGWDGWQIAREAGCTALEAGPGFAVLNQVAARVLHQHGCASVHISCEADDAKIGDLCAGADVPVVLAVFGRPPLMTTRAWKHAPPWTMEDARGSISIAPRQEGPVVALRPVQAYDWRGLDLPRIRVAHLEMDLCASADPVAEWSAPRRKDAHVFNIGRELA